MLGWTRLVRLGMVHVRCQACIDAAVMHAKRRCLRVHSYQRMRPASAELGSASGMVAIVRAARLPAGWVLGTWGCACRVRANGDAYAVECVECVERGA
jgi:hypothetical protein